MKKSNGHWTEEKCYKERCYKEALKYSTINDFRKNSPSPYRISLKKVG